MSEPRLVVIAGAAPRTQNRNRASTQDAIVKRWRMEGAVPPGGLRGLPDPRDVIPILDGWIRKLERQAVAIPDKSR